MKNITMRKIAAFLVVIMMLSVLMVSCGKKTSLSGTYYYDDYKDGTSVGDIKLTFYDNNRVMITTYEYDDDDYYSSYYGSSYSSVEEAEQIMGNYTIKGNQINFEFDSSDEADLPYMFQMSESLSFSNDGGNIVIGGTTFVSNSSSSISTSSSKNKTSAVLTAFKKISAIVWLAILALILVIVFKVKKNKENGSKNFANGSNPLKNGNNNDIFGNRSEVVNEHGWYRYQADNQPVIERTKEQQRIVDEYFIVRNYKTSKCEPKYKKNHKIFTIVSAILFPFGFIWLVAGLATSESALKFAGIAVLIGAIITIFLANKNKKLFENSINHTVAPKKLMTDEEFESLVKDRIDGMDIAAMGMERLGIDPDQVKEIRPIILKDKVVTDTSLRVYNKETNTLHSSTQYVTMLYFTDEELFVYKIQFDMCCNKQEEWAREFFYEDICDVSSYVYRNVVKCDDYQYEYSSIHFEIIASNSKIGFEMDGDNENISSIQGMKQKIRDLKNR